jgi:putative spermidine/putrescine transport system substrate-binding protein
LSSGDTWIVYNSNARTQSLAGSGVPVAFVAPKEGAGIVNNPVMIPAHAAHPRAAQALVNFILSDQVQNLLPKAIGYSPTSKNAVIPADLAGSMPSPADRLKYVFTDWGVISKRNQELSQLWTKTIETR